MIVIFNARYQEVLEICWTFLNSYLRSIRIYLKWGQRQFPLDEEQDIPSPMTQI